VTGVHIEEVKESFRRVYKKINKDYEITLRKTEYSE